MAKSGEAGSYFPRLAEDEGYMADMINNLYPENVPGKYYADDQRIGCDGCRQTAEEEARCAQAMLTRNHRS